MVVAAIVAAGAAFAASRVLPANKSTTKSGSPQTREFYLLSAEWNMQIIPSGLDHYGFTPSQIMVN
jgi:hypothetical protein